MEDLLLLVCPLQNSYLELQTNKLTVKERSVEDSSLSKRAPSPGIDGVNLNMAEGQVAELTFVETRAVSDEAEDDE